MNIHHYFLALSISTSLFCSQVSENQQNADYQVSIQRRPIDNKISAITITDPTTRESFTKWITYNADKKSRVISYSGDITTVLINALKEFERSNIYSGKRI